MHVPVEVAERARAAAAAHRADAIVCVGGGSATGLAKAVALTTGIPTVAVPTTYAGSEATNPGPRVGPPRAPPGECPLRRLSGRGPPMPRPDCWERRRHASQSSRSSVSASCQYLPRCHKNEKNSR
jgi:hypothetical protein